MTGYWAIDHFADMLQIVFSVGFIGIISSFIWGFWYSNKKQKEQDAEDLYYSKFFSK